MDNSVLKFSDLIGSDETFDQIISNIRLVKKELKELAEIAKKEASVVNPNDDKKIEELIKKVLELEKAKRLLEEQERLARKNKKKLNDLTEDELILREKLKIQNKERVQRAKQLAIISKAEKGSIEVLRSQLSLVTLEWKKLSKEERESGKVGKSLVKDKKRLTSQLKRLEKQTGDTRRNVGNYTDSLSKLGKVAARAFIGRSLVDGLRKIGSALSSLIESNKDTSKSIGDLDSGISKFIRAATNAATQVLEFFAPALTKIVEIGTSIIETFFGAGISINNFSATSDELKGVVESINKEFAKEIGNVDNLFSSLNKANASSEDRIGIIDKINKQYGQYLPSLLTEESTLKDIAKAQELVNEQLSLSFSLKVQEATQTDIFTNKAKGLSKAFDEIREASNSIGRPLLSNFNDFRKAGEILSKNAIAAQSFTRFLKDTETAADEGILRGLGLDKVALDLAVLAKNGKNVNLLFKNLVKANDEYNSAASDVSDNIASISKDIKIYDRSLAENSKSISRNTSDLTDNSNAIDKNKNARIKAIESLQNKLLDLEAKGIDDRKNKSLRLEDIKYKELKSKNESDFNEYISLLESQELLIIDQFGKNSKEVISFRKRTANEIIEFEKLNLELQEKQLQDSLDKKAKIEEDYALKRVSELKKGIGKIQSSADLETKIFEKSIKDDLAKATAEIDAFQEEQSKKEADRIANTKKRTEELFDNIASISAKISEKISEVFEKQSELAGELVEDQSEAVETQRQRAEQGLDNTLKFEQEQLAKREAEQIRAEQRAKQAAKILALFNLVSAYASNGDENALARGLVDFSLLQAFDSGFKEGGYTGDSATDSVAGHVHGQEYVVTAEDTAKYGLTGKSGGDFGDSMSDYFNQGSPLLNNNFGSQKTDFENGIQINNNSIDVSGLQNEFKKLRQSFDRMPRNELDVVWLTDYVIELTQKTIKGNMSKVEKMRRRLQ